MRQMLCPQQPFSVRNAEIRLLFGGCCRRGLPMRRPHSSTGVLSVTILGEIIHDKDRSIRLRTWGSDCRIDVEQQCLKLIDGSGSHINIDI